MMTKSNVGSFTLIPVVFVLTLFLILSMLSGSIIIAGSGVYQKIADSMDFNYDKRVSLSYLTTKIRQNDNKGNINVEYRNGIDMLAIREESMGYRYVTYLYYYEGYIRELFLDIDENGNTIQFDLSDGDRIIACDRCSFERDGDSIELTVRIVKDKDFEPSENIENDKLDIVIKSTKIALRTD